jgi:HJR/Mrr/RecB family endonuclease
LAQAELLYLRLDPQQFLNQVKASLLATETEVAEQTEGLRQQAQQVQDLLIRSGIQYSSEPARPLLASLERSFHDALEELLIFVVLSFRDVKEHGHTNRPTQALYERLTRTHDLLNQFRQTLGLDPTRSYLEAKASIQSDRVPQLPVPEHRDESVSELALASTNLLDLTPREFEALIANLFSALGFEVLLTSETYDGGADIVAVDSRPFMGTKVLIVTKRYIHRVPVAVVRDLYGTVLHEGAAKGILVTTSTFSAASYDFVKDKPLELIDGASLLYLLSEHSGLKVNIVPPDASGKDPQQGA